MAKSASAMKDDERLTSREQAHLKALDHLLRHERREALDILLGLLQQAPGDALALCLAIDLANAIGDRKSALRYVCI
jgi:predicted Zn-dependent protease